MINEQLKLIRKKAGLTQEQMTAGIITESYYSRVERGISSLSMDNLLAILNRNQISLFDFFDRLDQVKEKSRLKKTDFSAQKSTIGKRIGETRQLLGLTQIQMVHGIINASFYSRVERDQGQIRADDLVKILNQQQVSVINFLRGFGNIEPYNRFVEDQISLAFDQQNVEKIRAIIADARLKNKIIRQVAKLMINKLIGQEFDIDVILHNEFFKERIWDEDSLWLLSSLAKLDPTKLKEFNELIERYRRD